MTPGTTPGLEIATRFPHPQTCGYYGFFYFLPGLLAKKEMAPRSNRRTGNLLSVRVFEDRQFKQDQSEAHSIQARGRQSPQQGRIHTRRPYLSFSLFACDKAADHTYRKPDFASTTK
jgi:hypothetical protein